MSYPAAGTISGTVGARTDASSGRPIISVEIDLRRATEAVAAARRQLPAGGVVPEDYVFQGAGADGSPVDVRLSELFAPARTRW